MSTWTLPAESREWVGPIVVTLDGAPVEDFLITVVRRGQRPGTFNAPEMIETDAGVLVGPGTAHVLSPGEHGVWVKVPAGHGQEAPVIADVAELIIT